jgi:hypothetical protein
MPPETPPQPDVAVAVPNLGRSWEPTRPTMAPAPTGTPTAALGLPITLDSLASVWWCQAAASKMIT